MSPSSSGWSRRLESGRFDPRASARVRMGRTDLFKRPARREAERAAVSLVLDLSGSMATQAPMQSAMAAHVAQAMDKTGCNLEILGFTGGRTLTVYKDAATSFDAMWPRFIHADQAFGATTPLAYSIEKASRRLEALSGTSRILFVMTDGEDGLGADVVRLAVDFAKARGQIVVGIVISASRASVARFGFDTADAATVCPAADLGAVVLKSLADQLEAIKGRKAA